MVPKGWSEKSLSEICDKQISYGIVQTGPDLNDGIPCLRVVDLTKPKMNPTEMIKTSPEIHDSYKKTILALGEIVMALRGEVGLARMIDEELVGTNITRGLARLSADKNQVVPEFLLWELRSPKFRGDLIRRVGGSALQEISLSELRKVRALLPPLPEQKKIAQILSTWDQAITATERLLENSQQRKKGLMQQLLTGKKRLPGFEGEFKAISLSAAATITMGTSPKSAAYNSIGDGLPLLQGNADIEGRRSKPRVFTSEITKVCQPGDILLSVRAPVGSVAISHHDACIGRGICAIKAKNKNNQEFLYQWMLWYEPRWASLSQGSTFESVNSSDIKNLEIKLPEPAEQQAISHVLSVADRESELLENRLDQLKQEKKALMQQLLTGKRRVQVDTEAA